MTRWTHALRHPGPHPDQCVAEVPEIGSACLCNSPADASPPDFAGTGSRTCANCGHELVPMFSDVPGMYRPPEPRRGA